MDALEVFVSLPLDFPGGHYPLPYLGTRLSRGGLGDILEGHGRYLHLDVNAVHQGAADLVHVFLDLARGADAMVRRVAIVAARTGIHAGHEHERTRILYGVLSAADGDMAVFEGLAQHL